ncbi:hypothetical protein AC578_8549 [Pseudocercospora eumusae]|uniref:Uncharacterized protein n=1 Tax=Pseudocercospora eumusae TaxID=321146 RepID=A0A139HVZ4_9PEZI|nr:hypothetical protein AC578_8549 [Pseudocercospora eumusae]
MKERSSSTTPARRHHRENFPPMEYTDLSPDDIKKLAPLFKVKPQSDSPSHDAYEAELKENIGALPPHLRCKLPKLSTFCSRHHKINPLPIISLLEVVKDEVYPPSLARKHEPLGDQYFILQEVNAIWTKAANFRKTFLRDPTDFTYHEHKCAACKLALVAKDVPTLVALGGLIISRIKPKNWKKSIRILFMEEWIKASVDFSYQNQAPITAMFDLGVALNEISAESSNTEDDRDKMIEAFVAKTSYAKHKHKHRRQDIPYVPPERQYAKYSTNPFADEYSQDRTPTPGPGPRKKPAPPPLNIAATKAKAPAFRDSSPEPNAQSSSESHFPEDERLSLLSLQCEEVQTPRAPRARRGVASSVYSRPPQGDEEWDAESRLESRIIDSYWQRGVDGYSFL